MKHADLIARLEKLTGPDRKVDLEILARADQAGQWSESDIAYALSDVEGTTAPPAFTASLDAAVALVERMLPGWKWRVSSGYGEVFQRDPDCGRDGFAPTPAIALLIALLRALQESDPAKESDNG